MSEQINRLNGTLFIVATPIGHLGDMSFRAVETLKNADLVACEDTRTSGVLLSHYGISTRRVAYHEHNADYQRPKLLALLAEGKRIALISDAGTPLISDPGYTLVRDARAQDSHVVTIPGPSSVIAALSIGGLPTDRFFFAGFLPPKSAARQTALRELSTVKATLVLFESARRVSALLRDVQTVLGDREVAICRELTKTYEEVRRGTPQSLLHGLELTPARGELVVLIASATQAATLPPEAIEAQLRSALSRLSTKDAAKEVATLTGLPRQQLYEQALTLKTPRHD
ncbi:MAG: 16S rRNA (cytidine(1402)-2'-O)-methyltransferase [Rickettsiales bacterium]|nr:16S rRNA (cytidine(1402)-2'-O)-methyltransferase [Rickettsiales bacterium]